MKWRRKKSLQRRWNRSQLVNRDGATCWICTKPFKSMRSITIDHVVPLSKGGRDSIENMKLAHFRCNLMKADMSEKEFRDYQDEDEIEE